MYLLREISKYKVDSSERQSNLLCIALKAIKITAKLASPHQTYTEGVKVLECSPVKAKVLVGGESLHKKCHKEIIFLFFFALMYIG